MSEPDRLPDNWLWRIRTSIDGSKVAQRDQRRTASSPQNNDGMEVPWYTPMHAAVARAVVELQPDLLGAVGEFVPARGSGLPVGSRRRSRRPQGIPRRGARTYTSGAAGWCTRISDTKTLTYDLSREHWLGNLQASSLRLDLIVPNVFTMLTEAPRRTEAPE